jgi:hypothetical protein
MPDFAAWRKDPGPPVAPASDVRVWDEGGKLIFLKAVTQYGDPAELTAAEALVLAAELTKLAAKIE